MRNLKLKKVLPVATETETLQKSTQESDVGLHLVTDSVESVRQSSPDLQGVKETPGLHVMGDLFEVQCEDRYMLDAEFLKNHCVRLVKEAGLTTVGEFFKQFDGAGGVTGTVVLAESHLCIHTWPEKSYVTVDVYVCSYTQDNRPRARKLYQSLLDTFQPKSEKAHAVERL
jgi:S-adenosylmethionine decarboxylase